MAEVFWLVWNPRHVVREATNYPSTKHSTLRKAEEEAVRLSTQQPEEIFHILELIETFRGNIEVVCDPATLPSTLSVDS